MNPRPVLDLAELKRLAKPKPIKLGRLVKKSEREKLEDAFLAAWTYFAPGALARMPEREYAFHPTRKWRFDFAFVAERLAIELEGGIFSKGGHTRGLGYHENCVKYNAATEAGWRLLRFTSVHLKKSPAQMIEQVIRVLEAK